MTFSADINLLASGVASPNVVSRANDPRLAVDEATSGELLDHALLLKEFRHLIRKKARRLAEKQAAEREASRLQLQDEE